MFSTIRKAVSRMDERAQLSRGPTYEEARAALGGAPWREVPKSTDAWYILDDEAAALPAPAEPKRLRIAVVGAAVVATASLLFFVARSHGHETSLPPAAIAVASATAPPAPLAPPTASLPPPVAIAAPAAPSTRRASHAHAHHPKHDKHARR